MLVNAFKTLKRQNPYIELHIVGLSESQLPDDSHIKDIYCHGYLNKNDFDDRAKYYDLLRKAAVFCNPTEVWGGFSSTIEAMYYYTPIVIAPYSDFVAQFGEEIDFGEYNTTFTSESLAIKLQRILNAPKSTRQALCRAAHLRVKECDWKTYSARLLSYLNA